MTQAYLEQQWLQRKEDESKYIINDVASKYILIISTMSLYHRVIYTSKKPISFLLKIPSYLVLKDDQEYQYLLKNLSYHFKWGAISTDVLLTGKW